MSTIIVPGTAPNGAVDKSINTLGVNSVQIVPPSTGRKYILIVNPSLTNNIGISLSGRDAVLGSGGTIPLFPGGSYVCEDQKIISNGFNAVAASGINNGVTIWEVVS